MNLGIGGRVALVTAASKGLGKACARARVGEGVNVMLCARGEEALAATAGELSVVGASAGLGASVHHLAADVTEPGAASRLVDEAVERFGALHILVANAGGPPAGRSLEVDDAALEAALNANFLTTVRLVREAVPHMRSAAWGRVCAIASYSVKQPVPTLALSNSARTALWAWAKTAAADLVADGITLNLACPGPHLTDRMRELGGATNMGAPEDFGKVVAFLCSEPAAFVSGVALQVDGAATVGLL